MEIAPSDDEGADGVGFGSDAGSGADAGSDFSPHRHLGDGGLQAAASKQDGMLNIHSPFGLSMMLKSGWKPGEALGRDPGTPPPSVSLSFCLPVCLCLLPPPRCDCLSYVCWQVRGDTRHGVVTQREE